MELSRAEIAEIAGAAEAPTFATTIAALEDSGRDLVSSRIGAPVAVFAMPWAVTACSPAW